jgi:4'-phosphopantetheinyl transferase EntD
MPDAMAHLPFEHKATHQTTMVTTTDAALEAAIESLSLPGTHIGYRIISPGDEDALEPEEATAFETSVTKVRRASGAARIVARQLLRRVGHAARALPKAKSGAPIWPSGVVGSISHDSTVAIAAVALRRDFRTLGIDIEPAEALPSELLPLVATPQEQMEIDNDLGRARLLFVAKEAVYKAVHPLDQEFLDHHDVQINLNSRRGIVRGGRSVELRFCVSSHLLVLAFISAES